MDKNNHDFGIELIRQSEAHTESLKRAIGSSELKNTTTVGEITFNHRTDKFEFLCHDIYGDCIAGGDLDVNDPEQGFEILKYCEGWRNDYLKEDNRY